VEEKEKRNQHHEKKQKKELYAYLCPTTAARVLGKVYTQADGRRQKRFHALTLQVIGFNIK
jgi:hypothetical protein